MHTSEIGAQLSSKIYVIVLGLASKKNNNEVRLQVRVSLGMSWHVFVSKSNLLLTILF